MLPRVAPALGLVVLVTGCTCGPQRGVGPHRRGAPEIYLTGRVERDASGRDTFVPLMQTLAANAPCAYTHEVTLHVHDIQGLADHDYYVLVGPDYESGAPAKFKVRTSTATLNLTVGWATLVGQLPVSETDLVETSPEGTLMAIRVQQSPKRHYVYNLEPPSSSSSVKVVTKNGTLLLRPGTYVVVEEAATGEPQAIPSDDRFVAHLRARAAAAHFVTSRCP